MTDLRYYVDLLRGGSRVSAFHAGIRAVVRPGDRVLDLGCGVGTYAFFAARAGAERVWAVDCDPVVHVAESLAAANDLSGRVVCVRGDAAELELPAPVDVLIFEDFPTTLLDASTHRLLARVQRDLLARDGRMIPCAARLSVGAVRAGAGRPGIEPFPAGNTGFGLDWTPLSALLANHPGRAFVRPAELLAPPLRSAPFQLNPLPDAGALLVEGAWKAHAPGAMQALALWFDLEIGPGIWLSNEPREQAEPWGQVLLPMDPPLEVPANGRVEVEVHRETLPTGAPGWLAWRASCGNEARRGHEFGGLAVGPEDLRAPHPGGSGTPGRSRGTQTRMK